MIKNFSFIAVGLLCGMVLTTLPKHQSGPTFAGQVYAAVPVKQTFPLPQVRDYPLPLAKDPSPVSDLWGKATSTTSFVEEQDAGTEELALDDKPKEGRKPEPKKPVKPSAPDSCDCSCGCASCQCAGNVAACATCGQAQSQVIYSADTGEGRGGRVRQFIGRFIHRRGGGGCGLLGRRCGG